MPLTAPRDLFVHELADVLSAEHIFLGLLPELAEEALHPELKKALRDHEKETRGQIRNLEASFQALGESPEPTTCKGAEGIAAEHAALHDEQPAPDVLQLAVASGAAKGEAYEIVAYTGLVRMAKDLGEAEVARLLGENLAQERAMAKRLDAIEKDLGAAVKAALKAARDAEKAAAKRQRDEAKAETKRRKDAERDGARRRRRGERDGTGGEGRDRRSTGEA